MENSSSKWILNLFSESVQSFQYFPISLLMKSEIQDISHFSLILWAK